MFQIASFKIICTDSSEILFSQILLKSFFSKTRVCWFELSLAKTKFFTDTYCAGVSNKHCLLTFFIFAGPRNADGKVSDYRCASDCRPRGLKFHPSLVPYFRGN